jgi:predicted ArsR family transcriptional regulator
MTIHGQDLRARIADKLATSPEPLSTQQLGFLLKEKPATINYHLGVLVDRGEVERASTKRKRNATEYFYRLRAREERSA